MSKEISRRDFIKGAAAGVIGMATVGILASCETGEKDSGGSSDTGTQSETNVSTNETNESAVNSGTVSTGGSYTPGTYRSTAQGVGTVVVTMTFSEDAITDVEIDASGETASIGGAYVDEYRQAILDNQSSQFDAISGATVTSNAVMEAAENCIKQARGEIPVESMDAAGSEGESTANWLGEAPEIAESDIVETLETDMLIVGAGNGGMCAGAYATKNGLDFRIIEKGTEPARVRGWYGACDTEDILATGEAPMDRAAMLNELKRFSSGKANLKLYGTWFNESAAMAKFIKDCYAEYSPEAVLDVTVGDEARWPEEDPGGYFFPVEEHYWAGGELTRQQIFQKIIEEEGPGIDFQTSLVKLEESGGKVTGVIAQRTDTKEYIRINAKNGVLLACGGYPYNTDMMEQLDPLGTAVTTYNNGWPLDTGDGIKAAKWIGAAMQGEPAPMLFDRGIVAPGVDAGYSVTSTGDKVFPAVEGQFNIATQPFLKVNRRGERFTNESGTYDMMSYAAYNQPGHVYAVIFDGNMPEDVQRFHTIGCSAQTRNGVEAQLEKFDAQVEKGNAFIADTLDELADMLGFEGDAKTTFLATCDRYNEIYDNQLDDDFYKPAYRLSELRTAPFYGFWTGACLLTTEQGILCDERARVVDENREPIGNLYVCGDNAGGFFVNNYPCLMAGIAMGRNMTFAIKAVKEMAGIDQ